MKSYLSIMTDLSVEVERINVLRAEPNLRHFVEPGFDLPFEFGLISSRTRFVVRPSGSYVLANTESICNDLR